MADERDAKLILRAEDRATKTFDTVAKSIANVRKELTEQAKAAENGTGSLAALKQSLNDIKEAGADLNQQQAALLAFKKAGEAAEVTAGKVAKATEEFEAYRKVLGEKGKLDDPPKKLASLATALERATDRANKSQTALRTTRDAVEALGLSATDIEGGLDRIVGAFRELNPAFALATSAIKEYDVNLARASEAADELAAKQKFLANASKAGISNDQIAFVTDFREANRLLQETIDEEARAEANLAKATAQRRGALKEATREVLAGNAALEEQFAEIARLDAAAASANAFRKVASDAAAAAQDLGRFGTTATEANASLTRLADSIRQTIAPAVAEVQTLDGALRQVSESSDFAAKAQKARTSQYQDSLNKLTQAQAALVRQAQQIDAFRAQSRALQGLEADLGEAAARVQRLSAVLATVPDNANDVQRELAEAQRELERVGKATQTAGTRFEELGNNLKRVGVNINDLDGEFSRLEAGARRSAAAADVLNTKVGGNGKGFLGLKSYELTNLGYQINDVFTSLASGIPITQTLAQQGPQIAQLFPSVLSGALRLLPVIGPLVAGLGLIAYQLFQVKKAADAVKGFEQVFALSGNTAGYSAQQFGAAQVALEQLGNKADAAKDALREFIRAGLDPSSLDAFVKTADQIAKVTGESLPAAAEKLAAAYSGGYEQIAKLNDLLGGPLNDAQLKSIQNDFDAGEATKARTTAQDAFTAAAQRSTGAQTEGQKAATALGAATDRLGQAFQISAGASAIAEAAYKRVTFVLVELTDLANKAATALNYAQNIAARTNASVRTGFGLTGDFDKVLQENRVRAGLNPDGTEITPKKAKTAAGRRTTDPKARTTGGQEVLRQQQTELKNAKLLTAEERLRTAEIAARNRVADAKGSDEEARVAAVNARKIEQAKIDKENESQAKRSASAGAKTLREAETRQQRINALTLELRNTFLSLAPTDDPFAKIQADADKAINSIRDKFAKLGKLGVTTVDGKTQADFEAQVRAQAAIQTQLETQKKQERDLNALLEQRKLRIEEIQGQVSRGEITPLAGVDKTQAVVDDLAPKIRALIEEAIRFNEALRTATFDPKLEAFIAKLKTELSNVTGGDEVKAALDKALKDAQTNLDALVQSRNEYVRIQNALVQAGLQTETEAQRKIQAEYARTAPIILQSADAVEAIIQKMLALGYITPEVAEKIRSALAITRVETKKLDADIVAINQAIESALVGGISNFIETVGAQIAGVLDGTKSLGDALKGIAGAALSFAAEFTRAIAKAIIQLIALKIAKAAVAAIGLHSGGIAGVGQPTFSRKVPSTVFAGAIRYHSGGVAGLLPNEVPAILQKGEEVLTEDDPRHRKNGGLSPAAPAVNLKNINLFDPAEAVSQGLDTTVGEQAIYNVVSRNATKLRAALGLPG